MLSAMPDCPHTVEHEAACQADDDPLGSYTVNISKRSLRDPQTEPAPNRARFGARRSTRVILATL